MFKVDSNQKATRADALFRVALEDEMFSKKEAIVVYLELKNELGSSGDCGLQAALSLRKHLAQNSVKSFIINLNILSLTYSQL